MKRVIIFFLAFIYMLSTSGFAMQIHYCMGQQVGIDFFSGAHDKCGKCGMKEKGGCCQDDLKFFKLSTDQKFNPALQYQPVHFDKTLVAFFSLSDNLKVNQAVSCYTKDDPPLSLSGYERCRIFCIFRL